MTNEIMFSTFHKIVFQSYTFYWGKSRDISIIKGLNLKLYDGIEFVYSMLRFHNPRVTFSLSEIKKKVKKLIHREMGRL